MELIQSIMTEKIEVHVPQLMDMTLKEVIDAGKITNHYQTFVISQLTEFFKDGIRSVDNFMELPIKMGTTPTSVENVEHINGLSAEEQVRLASYLLDCVKMGETIFSDPKMSSAQWIDFVLQRQR